ncbi:cellulase family glycosylhydrolase [uncultured Bacteroides sp.]|uniref:cellulase family glycosylhydrolase n=1 Tax=uncultured Bacteroides sp. TaxID=162156 RepID=UPI002AA8E921|nr:cellulase family glycosylhydrolase [uncultured Bacteroides sp.]
MKKVKIASMFILLICLNLFFSCSDDDAKADPELTVAKEELTFAKESSMQKLAIKTNIKWSASSSEAWCTLSPSSGEAGVTQIEVSASENASTDVREAVITITVGSLSKQVTVSQAKTPLLIVKKSQYDVAADGGQITVELQTSDAHEVTVNNEWITKSTTRAVSDVSEVFTVAVNSSNIARVGTIIFSMAGLADTVTINQAGVEAAIAADETGMSSDAFALAKKIVLGWNLGNTMEVPATDGGETGWGNPKTTKAMIDAVKAAGFNAVRIPCAWDSYIEDETTYKVKDSWFARVKEVVDYCVDNNMYAILNIHWDGGWLENNPTAAKQEEVNKEQQALWTQIAVYFRGYDEHLLFAGTNEVHMDGVYTDPTTENITVQQSYNQTFVDAVRATGGKNAYRNLIVQTYNTNIAYGVKYMEMPADAVQNRVMAEVHYYDPYDFALNEGSSVYYWGEEYKQYGSVGSWGQEDYLDASFASVKTSFVDKGYPVILGEYGAIRRSSLTGDALTHHLASRAYYLKSVTACAKKYGLVPFYWDNGSTGSNGMGLFNRSAATVFDQQAVDALVQGAETAYP